MQKRLDIMDNEQQQPPPYPEGFQAPYSLVHVCRCGDIYRIFGFHLYSTDNDHRYGKFYWNFRSSSQSERSSLSVFGHIHRFWSYSFGHLHSVIFIRSSSFGQVNIPQFIYYILLWWKLSAEVGRNISASVDHYPKINRFHLALCVGIEINENLYVDPIGCCWKSVMTTKWLNCQGALLVGVPSCS